ncbi:MAG: hypothetical protein AAF368_06840 [Planctomycetota bacterium]
MSTLLALGALALFVWLLIPSRRPSGEPPVDSPGEDAGASIGVGTGLMGGDIEDAAVARYALSRTPKDPDSSGARDLGSAIGMQNIDPPL